MNPGLLLPVLARLSGQAAVVVVVIMAAQAVFRKWLSPRWRCALWLLLFARMALPFSAESRVSIFNLFSLPRVSAEDAGPALGRFPDDGPRAAAPAPVEAWEADGGALPAVGARAARAEAPLFPGLFRSASLWGTIWLAGFGVFTVQVIIRAIRWRRRLAGAARLTDPAVCGLLDECALSLGLRARPAVLESGAVGSPVLFGAIRPRLVLPLGFMGRFGREEVRFVFLHELAHLKRGDLLVNWLTTGLQAIHWFNPLVWVGFARWRADRECACDAAVLEAVGGGRSRSYGETIIQLLEGCADTPVLPGGVGVLDSPAELRARLSMIMEFRPGRRWSAPALVLLLALAVCCLSNPHSAVLAAVEPAIAAVAEAIPQTGTQPPAVSRATVPPAARPIAQPLLPKPVAGSARVEVVPSRPAPFPMRAAPLALNGAAKPAVAAAGSGVGMRPAPNNPITPVLTTHRLAVPLPVPAPESSDGIIVGGIGAASRPYGLSPAAYGKVLELREDIGISESQMVAIGILYMQEDRDRAALGRSPSQRDLIRLHRGTLNRVRILLSPGQRVQFNLIPASFGGGLMGMSPWSQLDRLDRLVGLAESQRWPLLKVYLSGTEHLMECQMPALVSQAKSVRLGMFRDIRSLLTPAQQRIWDATPAKDGGGALPTPK